MDDPTTRDGRHDRVPDRSDDWLVKKAYDHLRKHGVASFVSAAFGYATSTLPEPFATRFEARWALTVDIVRNRPSTAVPFADAVWAWRRGFTERLYLLYRLDERDDPTPYLDEVSRRRAGLINDHPGLMNDKQRFDAYLRDLGFGDLLPAVYGHVDDGEFVSSQYDGLREAVLDNGRAVSKKFTGGGGSDVYVCAADGGEITVHGKGATSDDLETMRPRFDRHLVTEYCDQASYIDRVYPGAANSIRMLTIRLPSGDVILPAAVHRIGSDRTGALDNFSQGGLSAWIDVETGELSAAAEELTDRHPRWHDDHPDTGEQIRGITVPGWEDVVDQVLAVASSAEAFDYVGWDVVVTATGECTILEANSYPNPDVMQVHEPLLTIEPLRRFYEHHGVVS